MSAAVHEFFLRLKAFFLKRRMDGEIADELAFHQAMLREKLLRQGVAPGDAEVMTRRRFGRAGKWHERLRELWQFRRLETLARDVRFSTRVLCKSPGFTVVAVLTLALGVGANTTVFSMINGLLLRPLPVPASDRLVVLGNADAKSGPDGNYSFSEPLFRGLEQRRQVFSAVFAFLDQADMQVKGTGGSEKVSGQMVSGDFFSALETPPLLGRVLMESDDRKGGSPAGFGVVISEGFWQSWLHRAPDVVGQKLEIDNTLFTIVGVMPKRFIGADPLRRPELFVPLAAEPVMDGTRSLVKDGVYAWWLTVMARMKPGVSMEQANADVAAASSPVLHEFVPDAQWVANREQRHFHFMADSGSTGFTEIRQSFRKPLLAVFAMCGGILLLACLNLASLLMARGTARRKELATRLALGATRRRIIQQLLVESCLIAMGGTAAGLGMAPLVSRSLTAVLLNGQHDTYLDTSLDLRVFAFAALAAAVAALLIGVIPAWRATSGELNEQMRLGGHTTLAFERRGMVPRAMMAAEVAIALMLMIGAGLLATSLVRLYRSGTGFDPHGIENIALDMDQQPLHGDALIQFYREMGDGLRRQPGVHDVSFAEILPFGQVSWAGPLWGPTGRNFDVDQNGIAPGYFQTLRIPLLEGRDFRWNDTTSSGLKIILNRAAVRELIPEGDPIGQIISDHGGKGYRYEVIGVAGDAKDVDVRGPAPPTAYHALTQDDWGQTRSYYAMVRTDGPAAPLAAAAYSLARQMVPGIPRPEMSSLEGMVHDAMSTERMMALLSVFFAVCALVVTGIGLYGTLAYSTARRTSEIGVRMALGAQRREVARMVFVQNAGVAVGGAVAGVVAALLASRVLSGFLYGTSTRDPWVYAGAILTLALIASAASLIPALRAARIQPMDAIRCE